MTESPAPVMLITGGTGSIGSEIAAQALASGWAVVIHGRRLETVSAVLEQLSKDSPAAPVAGVVADIAAEDTVEGLVATAAEQFGRLDAVVDCLVTGPAGARVVGPFDTTDSDGYLPLLELSVVAFQKLARAALPWLRQQGGCLVAFVSDAGVFPAPRQALIGAARAGTVGFVKNLAAEVARDGVRVHCVSPSFVEGTTTARKLADSARDRLEKARRRAGLGLPTPADIAPLVLFLCGDGARRVTGQVISINGGLNV